MTLPTPQEQKVTKPRGEKCLITSCKGRDNCLEHCPCDCHTLPNQEPVERQLQKIMDSYIKLKCTICFEEVNMLPGDKQSMKPAHIFCSMWGHSIDEHDYKNNKQSEWAETLRHWYKEKKITQKQYRPIKNLILQSLAHQKALSRAEVLEEIRGKIEGMKLNDEKATGELGAFGQGHDRALDKVKYILNTLSDTLAVVEEIKNKEEYV